jgi:Transposase and inactivated derivatives
MKNRIDTSRQKTPWDNMNGNTVLQEFVSRKYKENYRAKHPKLVDTDEANLLNSIIIKECRYCDSENIKKNGFTKNKIQRYYCKDCKKEFTPTTGTIFENHKISITEWVEFLLDIFYYGSTSLISRVNKNSMNTSIYWLQKVFLLLKEYHKDIILKNDIYLDEMFYTVMKSDLKTNDGKKLRGISQNQYCIGLAYDKSNIIAIVECLGKPSKQITFDTFVNHIAPNSKLIHDDEKSHKKLIKELNLIDESYNSSYLKKLGDKENPLRPINHQCDLIRQFLNAHSGFDREDLQDYLNLYCFMNNKPRNKLDKVNLLLELALTTKVSLKYRNLFETNNKAD